MNRYKKSDLKKGDIIGVCADAMYELRITSYSEKQKGFVCKCTKSYTKTIKVGDLRIVKPGQVFVKLGANGRKYPRAIKIRRRTMSMLYARKESRS